MEVISEHSVTKKYNVLGTIITQCVSVDIVDPHGHAQ